MRQTTLQYKEAKAVLAVVSLFKLAHKTKYTQYTIHNIKLPKPAQLSLHLKLKDNDYILVYFKHNAYTI